VAQGSTPSRRYDASASTPSVTGTTETVDQAPAGALEVQVSAVTVKFHPDELTAPAGTIVIFIHNETTNTVGESPHNMMIGVDLPPTPALVGSSLVQPGESATFTVVGLEPGTYRFWCSYASQDYGSHHAAGMVGTLTVTP
jgi:plastocyanin